MKIETLKNNRAKLTLQFKYAKSLNDTTEGRRLAARAAWKLMHEFNNNCDTVIEPPIRLANQIPAAFETIVDTSSRQWQSNAMRGLVAATKGTAAHARFRIKDTGGQPTEILISPK